VKLYIAVLLILFGAQSPPNASHDQKEIQTLIQSFVKTASDEGDLSVYLSPNKTPTEAAHQKEIIHRPFVQMKISGYFPESIKLQGADRASLATWADWKTLHESAAGNVTLHFEKVGGHWYFSDFDFVFFPWLLVFGTLGLFLTYIIPLAGFCIHLQRTTKWLPRERWKWAAILAVPFVGFVIYLVRKPWKKYPPRMVRTAT
jgi:hypothetical protein